MTNKLRIGFGSDMHLEFGDLRLKNNNDIDVLVLAGDILTPGYWRRNDSGYYRKISEYQKQFLRNVDADFPGIRKIYIPGNHEHYQGDYQTTDKIIRDFLQTLPNKDEWNWGEHQIIPMGEYTFYANTLWTDMSKEDPNFMIGVQVMMNDYRVVSNGDSRFRPIDTVFSHKKAMADMTENWNYNTKNIVISHHGPSHKSIAPGYRDSDLNPAYASHLDNWIIDHKPVLWIHGHMHAPIDYMLGDTHIISNPRGYIGHEPNVDPNYNYKVIEV